MSKQTNILPDNPQIEVIKSGRTGLFTNYIYKAIPLAFDESMSYYETLCGLLNYLKNVIIPTVNNNADAVSELQTLYEELRTYVDDYFKGLDVQEEINNKLDEMVEDGTLQEIIASYLNSKAIFGFDNVEDMKNATNLIDGSYAYTLGYYEKNDGGKSLYKIRNITNNDNVDNGSIIAMNNNILIAELIPTNSINVEQFGAKGDETNDDTTALKNAILYCKTNNKTLSSNGKRYLLTEDITIKNVQISFNWGCIISNQKQITLDADKHMWDYQGDRIIIVENMKFTDTNVISSSPAIDLNHLEFSNWHNIALKINSVRSVSDIYYNNDRSDANTVSIEINVPDKVITKLQGKGGFTGIVIKNSNVVIEDSQLWLSDKNRVNGTLDGSKFIHVITGSGLMFNNCVSDTYQYALYFEQSNIRGSLSNFQQINNNVLYNNCDMHFINKFEYLVGNAIARLIGFNTSNINYHINSPCLLDMICYDGAPIDAISITNQSVISLLQDYDNNDISSNITMDGYQCVKIKNGRLYVYLNFSFNTPNLNRFYLDTSSISGISMIRGYQYGLAMTTDNNVDSLQPLSISRATNNKISFNNQGSGYFKKISVCLEFPMNTV